MYAGVNAVTNPKSPITQYLAKLTGNEPAASTNPASSSSAASTAAAGSGSGPAAQTLPVSPFGAAEPQVKGPINVAVPIWNDDVKLDFYVYVSSSNAPSSALINTQRSDLLPDSGLANAPPIPFDAFTDLLHDPLRQQVRYSTPANAAAAAATAGGELKPMAAVKWPNIPLSDTSISRDVDLLLPLDENVRNHNGSIWADFIVTQHGVSPNPSDKTYHPLAVYRTRKLLSRLMPLKKKRAEKNLFDKNSYSNSNSTVTADSESKKEDKEEENATKIVAHWHKNLTLALVQDKGDLGVQLSQLPPALLQHVAVVRDPSTGEMIHAPPPLDPIAAAALDKAYTTGRPPNILRYPTLFPNDFWLLKEHMHPINSSVTEVALHIHLYHQTWFKFQTLAALSDSFDKQAGVTGGELDMFKTMLLETNPWFLALTMIVTLLHSLFEFLAFSSDVRHWKNKDDLAGVSVGSIVTNIVVQLIITLYLLDNNEETSWMILAGQAVGVLVECWKLTKAVSVSIVADATSKVGYRIKIESQHKLSEKELQTQEYDKLAFKYTGIVIGPILILYSLYSALYQAHKGWWSFIISTATSFVYAFGFVSLVPQLIVNYKLKSTAGMNSKTFIYKILGTFVDDLFAFCIKMPMLHRLACFRDDLVFFIFLYQRWIYGVDPTRKNEFGQVLENDAATQNHNDNEKNKQLADQQNTTAAVAAAAAAAAAGGGAKSSALAETPATLQSRSGRKKT